MSLNNDDIKQLIAILQRGLTSENESEETLEDTGMKPDTAKTKKKHSKKNPRVNKSPDSYNKFDTMPEHTMHKDDARVDQLLSRYPPSQRTREFQFVDVICRVCGKKESINPALVNDSPNRYKCNKCSRTPG